MPKHNVIQIKAIYRKERMAINIQKFNPISNKILDMMHRICKTS